jgi:hypothetical protein
MCGSSLLAVQFIKSCTGILANLINLAQVITEYACTEARS